MCKILLAWIHKKTFVRKLRLRKKGEEGDGVSMIQQGLTQFKPDASYYDHYMLFGYDHIKGNIKKYFTNWLNIYDNITPSLDLYFSNTNYTQAGLEQYFLNYIFAIESAHRRTSEAARFDHKEHEAMIATMLDSLKEEEEEVQEFWSERFAYTNEISLRTRLKEIYDMFKDELNDYLPKRKSFISEVYATRNYLVHYAPSLAKHSEIVLRQNWDIYIIKLKMMFQAYLMHLMGFSNIEIKDAFDRPVVNSIAKVK